MIPLQLMVGDWVDYSNTTLAGGRRSQGIVRIQCVEEIGAGPDRSWLIEMLPLTEIAGGLEPQPGQGWLLQISAKLLRREGELTGIIERIVEWTDGQPTELTPAQWRDDPLIAASLEAEFTPQAAELIGTSIRVVAGQHLSCDHFQFTAADTQRVTLPRGCLEQVSVWEVTVAVNNQVPFLGIVFASERTKSQSSLDPPSERFELPPPTTKVETMELVAYGNGARPTLVER